jgi:2-polyprenyl-3-methyl-5-hydroxy-6-metoxy-1,4-benzoquinol methylase
MKRYILLSISIVSCINAMEQQITQREAREWNAQAYAQGNRIQETAALQFLQESGIDFTGKRVIDVGCGTGNISKKIAQQALLVHGIDASNNMIEYAKKTYQNAKKLSFEQCFAEDFTTREHYNVAVTFFCLQYIQEKEKVLQNINKALHIGDEFFGNMHTASDPEHLNVTVGLEMIPGLKQTYDFFKNTDIIAELGLFDQATDEHIQTMFTNNGFEIVSYKHITSEHIIKNRGELESYSRPLVMSRPFAKMLPETIREWLFSKYIDLYLTKLKQNTQGDYIFPAICTTVFHACKIADI